MQPSCSKRGESVGYWTKASGILNIIQVQTMLLNNKWLLQYQEYLDTVQDTRYSSFSLHSHLMIQSSTPTEQFECKAPFTQIGCASVTPHYPCERHRGVIGPKLLHLCDSFGATGTKKMTVWKNVRDGDVWMTCYMCNPQLGDLKATSSS